MWSSSVCCVSYTEFFFECVQLFGTHRTYGVHFPNGMKILSWMNTLYMESTLPNFYFKIVLGELVFTYPFYLRDKLIVETSLFLFHEFQK